MTELHKALTKLFASKGVDSAINFRPKWLYRVAPNNLAPIVRAQDTIKIFLDSDLGFGPIQGLKELDLIAEKANLPGGGTPEVRAAVAKLLANC